MNLENVIRYAVEYPDINEMINTEQLLPEFLTRQVFDTEEAVIAALAKDDRLRFKVVRANGCFVCPYYEEVRSMGDKVSEYKAAYAASLLIRNLRENPFLGGVMDLELPTERFLAWTCEEMEK